MSGPGGRENEYEGQQSRFHEGEDSICVRWFTASETASLLYGIPLESKNRE
jgi:hypothetical protein